MLLSAAPPNTGPATHPPPGLSRDQGPFAEKPPIPTYKKTPDIELTHLKTCLGLLADELLARADRISAAPSTTGLAADERARLYQEQAWTLRTLLVDVEALEPYVDEPRLRQVVRLAPSKALLHVKRS